MEARAIQEFRAKDVGTTLAVPVRGSPDSSSDLISITAALLLCVLPAGLMAGRAAAHALLKKKPSVELQASTTSIIYPCSPGGYSMSRSCPSTVDFQVGLTAITRDFNKQQVFVYTVTGGRVVGEGSKVTWDLSGSQPNVYTATVEVQDNKRHRALSSVVVKLLNCGDCVIPDPDLFCPTIVATCDNEVRAGTPVSCTVKLQPSLDPKATPPDRITYEWSARDSAGKDVSGRINGRGASISIRTDGLGGQLLATTVKVKGLDPACSETAVDSTAVKP